MLRRLVVLSCVFAASCAVPVEVPGDDRLVAGGPAAVVQAPQPLQPFAGESGHGGVAWIPWATLDLDARPRGGGPTADLDEGRGFAVRGGRYDDALGAEFVFAMTEHDDHRTGAELRSYAAYVDLTDRWQLTYGRVFLWSGIGVGAGLAYFDWNRDYSSDLTGLWQGEGILALQIGANVAVEARAIGFFAAHPGESLGTGAMAMLGGSVSF